ncbi:hypothetical protein ACWD0J_27265 [Streptomyces sp. NPDC003011]
MTAINGTEYEWTATTANDAVTALDCATQLVYAHLRTAFPNGGLRTSTQKAVELPLTIRLDLKSLVELTNAGPGADENPGGDSNLTSESASQTATNPSDHPRDNYTT